jgi:hypothetical protein
VENFNLKKFFLYLLICSIALSALMGIWAILSGEFGDLQARVLGTTLTVVGTSILGLACGAFLESPRSRTSYALFAVPLGGIILAVLSALITLWLIWGVTGWGSEGIYKTLFVFIMFAFALAQLSLLSLARLSKRFRWAIIAAYAAVLGLASIVSFLIIIELRGDDGTVMRLIGVLAVVDAALTVMIPILHRLSRTEFVDVEMPSVAGIDSKINALKAQIERLEKQKEDILRADEKA